MFETLLSWKPVGSLLAIMPRIAERTLSLSRIVVGLVMVCYACGISGAATSERDIFLVDISGSMLEKPRGQESPSGLQIRQEKLKEWLEQHKDSTVGLMAFNTAIRFQSSFDLSKPAEWDSANSWIDRLKKSKPKGTNLWRCLQKAVGIAAQLAHQQPGEAITLHVLTDGRDTENVTTLEDVVKRFADLKLNIRPKEAFGLGDFDVELPNNSPVPSQPPMASPSPSPSSVVSILPPPTPTPSSSPPPANASISPSVSPASSIAVLYQRKKWPSKIQEPRIVFDGQFVHFINKTHPSADSYEWTVRWNKPMSDQQIIASREANHSTPVASAAATPSASKEEETATIAGPDLVYQFRNPDKVPRSYSVLLTGIYPKQERIVASPLNILVQAHGVLQKVSEQDQKVSGKESERRWALFGAIATSLIGIIPSLVTALWKSRNQGGDARGSETRSEGKQRREIAWAMFALSVILCGFFILRSFGISDEITKAAAARNSIAASQAEQGAITIPSATLRSR